MVGAIAAMAEPPQLRTSGNQIGQLPVQSQRLADEVTAAKAGQQGEDH